jgi:hypothetical protein
LRKRGKAQATCVIRLRPDCKQLLFLYQGGAGRFYMSPLRFLRLSGAKQRSLVMFRDPRANYYHGEIHPGRRGIDQTIESQRQIRDECTQANQLYCSGTSMGAYAALLFGHYLKADVVHAFGAKTLVNRENVHPRIVIPDEHEDLSRLLSNWNGHTRYKLYYSDGYQPDCVEAQRLANCPGVELIPLPGVEHNVFKDVDTRKLLGSLFPPLEESR